MPARALVWLKRDLRLADHAPLAAAAQADEALALYLIEPEALASPEFDPQHLAYALASLAPLRAALAARGLPLQVEHASALQALSALHRRWPFDQLFSHEETGPGWSYQRDLAVAAWCRQHGVAWREWPQTGVVRRLRSRQGWAGRWAERMSAPIVPTPPGWRAAAVAAPAALPDLPSLPMLGLPPSSRPLPAAGEAAAQEALADFLAERGRGYRRNLSSPLSAERGCSRLSAHLAFGSLSMRQVHQATEAAIDQARGSGDAHLAYDLRGFASRLRWHCHFMQKLEDEPDIEFRPFSPVYSGLRPGDGLPIGGREAERLAAWCEGRTGYPMVDACMRSLRATGWLNFRMRAMLVSFAAYHLWLHWREPGLFLARQFLDFEPGIHWSQMQMQSGTTGINTLRIYSPARQAAEHDPTGAFVRRWVPEAGTPAYPAPIVDERSALAEAKAVLYGLRRTPEAQAEADRVQARHGSRQSGLPPTASRRRPARKADTPAPAAGDDRQLDLFG